MIHARIQAEMTAWARGSGPDGCTRTVEQVAQACGIPRTTCWRRLHEGVAWELLEILRAAEYQATYEGDDGLWLVLLQELSPRERVELVARLDVERRASDSIGASAGGIAADNAALADGAYTLREMRARVPSLRAEIAAAQHLLDAIEAKLTAAGEVRHD